MQWIHWVVGACQTLFEVLGIQQWTKPKALRPRAADRMGRAEQKKEKIQILNEDQCHGEEQGRWVYKLCLHILHWLWTATVGPRGWKATRRGWSSGVMWPNFIFTDHPGSCPEMARPLPCCLSPWRWRGPGSGLCCHPCSVYLFFQVLGAVISFLRS